MQRPAFAVLMLMCLGTSCLLPILSSAEANGGLLFDANSITLDGDGEVGDGFLWVNLTVMEKLGDFANATLQANLSTIEGAPVTKSHVINASADSSHQVALLFDDVAVGIYTLEINLSGDIDYSGVGPDNATGADWNLNWSGIVSKLRPLSIGLASTGQWDLLAVDGSGNSSGNSSVRDGDNLSVEIPVVNYGDVNSTGSLQWSFDGGNLSIESVTSVADMTSTFNIELGIVSEGSHNLTVSINFSGDTDSEDNSATLQFTVLPPPLPRLAISISSTTATVAELGDSVEFTLTIANDGEIDWSGQVECTNPDPNSVVFLTPVNVLVGQTTDYSANITATPGRFECVLKDGGRIADDSTALATYPFTMQAAEFTTVGDGEISISGGPWHIGDVVSTNLLVYNAGDYDGTAALFLRHGSNLVSGSSIAIESGGGGLLVADVTVAAAGESVIEWWVSSLDASVAGDLSGNFTISAQQSQTLQPEFTSVVWDASNGISSSWTVELSPGIERVVGVEIGITVNGIDEVRQQYSLTLSPGQRELVSHLGEFAGQGDVYVRLTADDWLISDTSEDNMPIPSERPILRLVQESKTAPISPLEHTSATITCSLYNDGLATSKGGIVRLLDSDGRLLDETTSQPLVASPSGHSVAMDVSSWPSGKVVDMQCWWRVGDEILVDDQSHISGIVEGDEEGLSGIVPLTNVFYGIIFAVVITLVSRLAYGWKNAVPSTATSAVPGSEGKLSRKEKAEQRKSIKSDQREKRKTTTGAASSTDKLEVSCTSCKQKLSVPAAFSGTVRCPSCRHEFGVEAEPELEMPEPVTSTGDEVSDELPSEVAMESPSDEPVSSDRSQQLVVTSESDILSCPDCEANLRVPLEKRPVRARCPACKTEFMAHSN